MILLTKASRATEDIDIFWLDTQEMQEAYIPLKESVQTITQRYDLDGSWFNYLSHMLMFDEVLVPDGKLWKCFGPLHVYAPSEKYMLALKIAAGREKDIEGCDILIAAAGIQTREQAQQLVEMYLLPVGLRKHAEEIKKGASQAH